MVDNIQFYDIQEVAKELDVSTRTIRRYIDDGKLTAFKIGNKVKIRPEDLDEFIENSKMNKGR